MTQARSKPSLLTSNGPELALNIATGQVCRIVSAADSGGPLGMIDPDGALMNHQRYLAFTPTLVRGNSSDFHTIPLCAKRETRQKPQTATLQRRAHAK